ncbi:MAG: DinB family protein [Planctomycetota bacterium]
MSLIAQSIVPGAKITLNAGVNYAEGIKPETFHLKPAGVNTNTPSFVFGHLAIYPDGILEMLGRGDLAQPSERFKALFDHGCECLDGEEAAATYPPMNEIVARYKDRHEVAIKALSEATDEQLSEENPHERMRERFPTKGSMINFLLGAHAMMHLGQVSAWRRCMGMGPAM